MHYYLVVTVIAVFYTVVFVVVVMDIHNAMCKASHSFRFVYDYSAVDLEMWRSTNVHANQTKQNKNSSLKRELKRFSRLHPQTKVTVSIPCGQHWPDTCTCFGTRGKRGQPDNCSDILGQASPLAHAS